MLTKTIVSAALVGIFAAGAAFAEEIEVSIYDNDFMPPLIYAHPGDTIIFLNEDEVTRQATADDDSWTTGPIAPSETAELPVTSAMALNFKSVDTSQDEDGNTVTPTAEVTFASPPTE